MPLRTGITASVMGRHEESRQRGSSSSPVGLCTVSNAEFGLLITLLPAALPAEMTTSRTPRAHQLSGCNKQAQQIHRITEPQWLKDHLVQPLVKAGSLQQVTWERTQMDF